MNDIFKKVADMYGVDEKTVRNAYNLFFIKLKAKLSDTDIYSVKDEDEFHSMCHSFRIPKIGRLDVDYKYLKKEQDAYRKIKKDKTDIQ